MHFEFNILLCFIIRPDSFTPKIFHHQIINKKLTEKCMD